MKTVIIYPPIEIHDDPKFCNDQKFMCVRIFRGQCEQFFKNLKHDFPEAGQRDLYQKCEQCKDLYKDIKFRKNCKTQDHIV